MKGDFTRDTFDPLKHFSRVLMQQGRVQLDADWNEQTAILLHYLRTLATDILGPHAGPAQAMGFAIITNETVKQWAASGLNVDAEWAGVVPDEARRKILRDAVEHSNDAVIGRGRYYVHGVLAENHRAILYTEQPGYPFTPEMELANLQGKEIKAYLDVWERHITCVEDGHIREVALGGADTCTRAQVVWQVKALVHEKAGVLEPMCAVDDHLLRKVPPLLRARARRGTRPPELCSVAPESKYRGLENQLYRVEVHEVETETKGGQQVVKSATFKWSRDNGSVVFPIVLLSGTTAVVASLGRDQCSQLKPGDWVEVCDDVLALREQAGPLARVQAVDRDEMKVTLKWPAGVTPPAYAEDEKPGRHPLLRRWDHAGDLAAYRGALPIAESDQPEQGWIELEDGVQVWFAKGGQYRPGDYWLIPARVATGDVEWPLALDAHGMPIANAPAALPPHGPQHYYAPLYDYREGQPPTDCRCKISPLPCG